MSNPVNIATYQNDDEPIRHIQLSNSGYLLVALEETRVNALHGNNLKAVLSQYNVEFDGLALHVWDETTESWVKLTSQMLERSDRDPS